MLGLVITQCHSIRHQTPKFPTSHKVMQQFVLGYTVPFFGPTNTNQTKTFSVVLPPSPLNVVYTAYSDIILGLQWLNVSSARINTFVNVQILIFQLSFFVYFPLSCFKLFFCYLVFVLIKFLYSGVCFLLTVCKCTGTVKNRKV